MHWPFLQQWMFQNLALSWIQIDLWGLLWDWLICSFLKSSVFNPLAGWTTIAFTERRMICLELLQIHHSSIESWSNHFYFCGVSQQCFLSSQVVACNCGSIWWQHLELLCKRCSHNMCMRHRRQGLFLILEEEPTWCQLRYRKYWLAGFSSRIFHFRVAFSLD